MRLTVQKTQYYSLNSLNFTKKKRYYVSIMTCKKGNIDQGGIHKGKSKVARNEKYNVGLLMHKILHISKLFTSTTFHWTKTFYFRSFWTYSNFFIGFFQHKKKWKCKKCDRTLPKNTVVLPYCDVREKEDDDVALFPFRRHLEGQSKIAREITQL